MIKISSVSKEHFKIAAKAMVFSSQAGVKQAFDNGMLEKDVIVVVRGQGPRANGMPELHSLTPMLSVIQEKGFKVALVTFVLSPLTSRRFEFHIISIFLALTFWFNLSINMASALNLSPDLERIARAENFVEDGKIAARRD